jgi:hypothetical protein
MQRINGHGGVVGATDEAAMCASTLAAAVSAAAAAAAAAACVVVVLVLLLLVLLVVPEWSMEEGQICQPVCWSPGALEGHINGSIRLANKVSAAAQETRVGMSVAALNV